jgi:hypothetical protein
VLSRGWIEGVLSPIALCGLTSLYSVCHSSTFSRASSRSRNQWRPRHSHRTAILRFVLSTRSNLSEYISGGVMPLVDLRSHYSYAIDIDSGADHESRNYPF